MSGFASGIAGGGGYSASASATSTSGPATGGALGLNIQGITTGNASNGGQSTASGGTATSVALYIGLALLAVVALELLRRR
jgi:MYXO-CTERM domain-containing protein